MEQKSLIDKLFDAFANVSEGRYIFLCDFQKDVSRWSKGLAEKMGVPADNVKNAGKLMLDHIHPNDRKEYQKELDAITTGKRDHYEIQCRVSDKNGVYSPCYCKAFIIKDEDGKPVYFAGSIDDFEAENELSGISLTYTRAKLFKVMKENRETDSRYSLLAFKICDGEGIENVYGYDAGRRIVRLFGEELLKHLDKYDTFYLGGGRFVLLSYDKEVSLKDEYKKICHFGKHSIVLDNIQIAVLLAASYGDISNTRIDEKEIYSSAVMALKESENNNGKVVPISINKRGKSFERASILSSIRNSIAHNCKGFYLCYQPVFDSLEEKLIGAEALVRWKGHPYGEVLPSEFIPWLEKEPLFYDLGLWILETALTEFKDKVLSIKPEISLSVNISYVQLKEKSFRDDFLRVLKRTEFPVDKLIVEFTEKCKLLEEEILISEINFFKKCGVKVFVDDYGTGYADVACIMNLPIDGVKIDRKLIKHIEDNKRAQTVLESFIGCTTDLGVRCTIEGIEDKATSNLVKQYGATAFQGFLFSKPITIDEFVEMDSF